MHPALACSILLAIHLRSGASVVEHASYDDRIAWVLPPDRLAAFARSGVVIDEDVKTMVVAQATAAAAPHGMTTLRGTVIKVTTDVPRHRTARSADDLSTTVTPRNEPLPARVIDVEDAAMTELPVGRLCVGQSWDTRIPVMTTLGSGIASIHHTVSGISGGIVEVDVRGSGVISGMEYNLPRLLPGSIGIRGTAWFDIETGFIRQESYLLNNRLIRTVKRKTIGFIETETVDSSDHTTAPPAGH
jgi:hypothetical protein